MMKQITYIITIILLSCGAVACGTGNTHTGNDDGINLEFTLCEKKTNPYLQKFDSMPDGGRKLKINNVGVLGRTFNDSNYLHLQAAEALGINPIETTSMAWKNKRPLVKIETSRNYYVDELTHSLPYLVPEAKQLLEDIARTWVDTLNARGGGYYRLKVTSVLRTPATIAKLRRRNRNAVDASAHRFGTTFDISYAKFICDSVNIPRTQEDLKNLLGEILQQFRSEGRCYVKYERKQGCFHITARPVANQKTQES